MEIYLGQQQRLRCNGRIGHFDSSASSTREVGSPRVAIVGRVFTDREVLVGRSIYVALIKTQSEETDKICARALANEADPQRGIAGTLPSHKLPPVLVRS